MLTSLTRTHFTLGAIYNYKLNVVGGTPGFRLTGPLGIKSANVGALAACWLTENGPVAYCMFGRTCRDD